jgi:hypothetical protein
MPLVEDVPLAALHQEDDAWLKTQNGWTIGIMGSAKSSCQTFCTVVIWQLEAYAWCDGRQLPVFGSC